MPTDVSGQIDHWQKELLDSSRRNPLINFKSGRTGGIMLKHPSIELIWTNLVAYESKMSFVLTDELLGLRQGTDESETKPGETESADGSIKATRIYLTDEEIRVCCNSTDPENSHLVTNLIEKSCYNRLRKLANDAKESMQEKGVATLYLAFGFLRWYESEHSEAELLSPLVLVPCQLNWSDKLSTWILTVDSEEPSCNETLNQLLIADFRLELPDIEEYKTDSDKNWEKSKIFLDEIAVRIKSKPRWEVRNEVALGRFDFQKYAMWKDLADNRERIVEHPLCRALAGDSEAIGHDKNESIDERELDDRVPPVAMYHILDADSSQHAAIETAKSGSHLILEGPPGTGKSQTIANMIAEFLALGKTVLFVSEKVAALEVVKNRLDKVGLGGFCLELHSHKTKTADILKQFSDRTKMRVQKTENLHEQMEEFHKIRRGLNSYVRSLHQVWDPLGKTVYQVRGELTRLERTKAQSKCLIHDVLKWGSSQYREVVESIEKLKNYSNCLTTTPHPWSGCKLKLSEANQPEIEYHLKAFKLAIESLLKSVPILKQLGFCSESPTWAIALRSSQEADRAAKCPEIPKSWLSNWRVVSHAVIRFDELTREYRALLRDFPEINIQAIPASLPEFKLVISKLKQIPDELLLQRKKRLIDTIEIFPKIISNIGRIQSYLGRFKVWLNINISNRTIAQLFYLASFIQRLYRLNPAPAWWNLKERKRLILISQQCHEQLQEANHLRKTLQRTLIAAAFDTNNSSLLRQAFKYRSFWARLLSSHWKKLRPRVESLYSKQIPERTRIFEDLGNLNRYHSLLDDSRQNAEDNADALSINSATDTDWANIHDRLAKFDEELGRSKLPEDVQVALSCLKPNDIEALLACCKSMQSDEKDLKQSWDLFEHRFNLDNIMTGSNSVTDLKLKDLLDWINQQQEEIRTELKCIQLIQDLLLDENLPADRFEARFLTSLGLIKLRNQSEITRRLIPELTQVTSELTEDWAVRADVAKRLIQQLGPVSPVPEYFLKAITEPNLHAMLTRVTDRESIEQLQDGEKSWQYLTEKLFPGDLSISTGIVLRRATIYDLHSWLTLRCTDIHRIQEWNRFQKIEHDLVQNQSNGILNEIRKGEIPLEVASDAFQKRFYAVWLDAIVTKDPVLAAFDSENHNRNIDKFRQLDRKMIEMNRKRVYERVFGFGDRDTNNLTDAPPSSELGILYGEIKKTKRHMPLRKLFAKIPTVLLRLEPCLMMSPLAVSTYLASPDLSFDVVIFDEASQVRPHEAISAIYRGKQLIVAGDEQQMPPSDFFQRTLENEDIGENDEPDVSTTSLSHFESILSKMGSLVNVQRRSLLWHYRSKSESLIAFSNFHFYKNQLVTFPSKADVTGGQSAIRFEHVPNGRWLNTCNPIEAQHVAVLILQHFQDNPSQSLGVIAFNQKQQHQIQDELAIQRKNYPALDQHFKDDKNESLFIKSLETVQGDERDVIFLTVGYGPDPQGNVAMRFGPLSQAGGERRLNVAITRSRIGMTVVSSLRKDDIDISNDPPRGRILLHHFLDYAENGRETLKSAISQADCAEADSPFEIEVSESLQREGLSVHRQIGCGKYRIDLAIYDPAQPGTYLLGVECDGAMYHSSATARDRDRLRQEVLESMGWRLCRIWSTDWWINRAAQIQKVLAAFERARKMPFSPVPSILPDKVELVPDKTSIPDHDNSTPPSKPKKYKSISEVPEPEIVEIILEVLTKYGSTSRKDVIDETKKELGFQRLGEKIQSCINDCIDRMISDGRLSSFDEEDKISLG